MAEEKKSKNKNLQAAREAKNDEFYTALSDIQSEINNYVDKFKDKVVFCNCDDPFESNFVKFFLMNFNRLGLKELIATGYKTSPVGGSEISTANMPYVLRVTETHKYLVGTQKDLDVRGAKYFLETEGNHIMSPLIGNAAIDNKGNKIQVNVKLGLVDNNGNPILDKNGKQKTKIEKQDLYYEAGDFRSDMSLALLQESDIVVTNPPFSLFREYVATLIKNNKHFLIIGSKNCITYKEIFPLIKNNKLWIGAKQMSGSLYFTTPNSTETVPIAACWFTNIDHPKRHIMLPLDLGFTYKDHEDMYPKYENYNAININKTAEIPCDYTGAMGVPITFLDRYCPEQFLILGHTSSNDTSPEVETLRTDETNRNRGIVNGKQLFDRILIKRKEQKDDGNENSSTD